MRTPVTPQRKSATCYTKPIKSIVPENYCYIKGCIYNSLYRCDICRNHVCINHKLGDTKDFLVCSECYVNEEYREIIYTNGIHYYNKNKRCKYFQIFLNFISFEWTRNKVQPSY